MQHQSHNADVAFFLHDMFNILCVSVVVILNFYYLSIATNVSLIGTSRIGEGFDKIFQFLWCFFNLYTLVDTIWVFLMPHVASAGAMPIIIHHILTIASTVVPYILPQFQWHMGIVLTVELNTLLLTLRRNVPSNSNLFEFINILFLTSWVVLRLIIFPLIVVFFYFEYQRYSSEVGTFLNAFALGFLMQILLTAMGLKWTYDLGKKFLQKNEKDH